LTNSGPSASFVSPPFSGSGNVHSLYVLSWSSTLNIFFFLFYFFLLSYSPDRDVHKDIPSLPQLQAFALLTFQTFFLLPPMTHPRLIKNGNFRVPPQLFCWVRKPELHQTPAGVLFHHCMLETAPRFSSPFPQPPPPGFYLSIVSSWSRTFPIVP